MLLFCDTSSLLKLIIEEDGSATMARLAGADDSRVAVASLAYAEAHAALARRRREGVLLPEEFLEARKALDRLWPTLLETSFDASSRERIPQLCSSWPLRGADAVHLASAIALRAEGIEVRFVTSDRRQFEAAEGEGLRPTDPTTTGT